jgi:TPR repeat protein
MHERGGRDLPRGNYKTAALFRDAAAQGDAYSTNRLGEYYYYGYGGLGTHQDQAVNLFKDAAAKGNAAAMANLGYAYLNGRGGLTLDKSKARDYFERAVAQGDRMGQANLAYMYEYGWAGLQPNINEALRLYRLAATPGSSWAQDRIDRINRMRSERSAPPSNTPVGGRLASDRVTCWWNGVRGRRAADLDRHPLRSQLIDRACWRHQRKTET